MNDNIEPVKHKDIEPVKHKDIEPVKHKDIEPVKHKDIEPVKHKDIEPVKHKDIEPVKHKDIEPVKNTLDHNKTIQNEEIINKITLNAEKFDIEKEIVETQMKLEKKWVESTKKIEIPVRYEELYINGKDFDSYDVNEIVEVFSKLKDKISEVFHHNEENKKHMYTNTIEEQSHSDLHDLTIKQIKTIDENNENKKHLEIKEKTIPLSSKFNDYKNNIGDTNDKEIIPIWGEEITINKKVVKLGEIIIRKYQVSEKHNIEVELKKEKLTVKYPGNIKEEIT